MKTILSIASIPVSEHDDLSITYLGGAEIDGDGSGGNAEDDPCFQSDTTLHYGGKAINARVVPFIVVPPQLRLKPSGIVMGCQARIVNTVTGQAVDCVVADVGPKNKLGEISIAAARAIGIDPSPISGGTKARIISYTLWPGKAAVCQGKTYKLIAA